MSKRIQDSKKYICCNDYWGSAGWIWIVPFPMYYIHVPAQEPEKNLKKLQRLSQYTFFFKELCSVSAMIYFKSYISYVLHISCLCLIYILYFFTPGSIKKTLTVTKPKQQEIVSQVMPGWTVQATQALRQYGCPRWSVCFLSKIIMYHKNQQHVGE